MADRADITPELCRQLLRYEPETGKLYWRERDPSFFADQRSCRSWNSKFAGREALTARCLDKRGRLSRLIGQILECPMKAHRVAWAIYYGAWPTAEVDHVDGDPSNNRIANLRDVSHQDNTRNTARPSDNTSGAQGVGWNPRTRKWTARVGIHGRVHYIGEYGTVEEASEARRVMLPSLGFHENHGAR